MKIRVAKQQESLRIIEVLHSFITYTGLVVGRTLVKSNPKFMPVLVVDPYVYLIKVSRGSLVVSLTKTHQEDSRILYRIQSCQQLQDNG